MTNLGKSNILFPSAPFRILLHTLFWLVLLGLRLYLTRISFNVYSGFPFLLTFLLNLSNTILTAAVFYSVVYGIWPRYIMGKKYFPALLFLIAVIVVYTCIDAFIEKKLILSCNECIPLLETAQKDYLDLMRTDLPNIALVRLISLGTPAALVLFLAIPFSMKMALNAWRGNIRALQLSKDNLQLEYNFLKAQINPHFLFNSLNNIYGLIIVGNNEKSAHLVSRLSELLRYILYDSDQDVMPLGKEINLLEDYVELEKVRLNHIKVDFKAETDGEDYEIAPLLLMPLFENAFKFSPDIAGSEINIFLEVRQGRLKLSLDNTADDQKEAKESGGIGLANLKKRLDLYYPGHHYEQYTDSGSFVVLLSLALT